MAKRRSRKYPRLPSLSGLKRFVYSLLAVAASYLLLVLLNDGIGSGLPLPSAGELEAQISGVINTFYQQGGLAPAPARDAQAQGELTVHYIDVGQGDSQLIQTPEQTVLIDAGDVEKGDIVTGYLESQGVGRIDLLIATHPHADHIGGMSEVVERFDVGKIVFADLSSSMTPTTKTYEKLLDAIAAKGGRITRSAPGTEYDLGGGARLTLLAPLTSKPDDLNGSSVVCRLSFGETAFLFTGDAESPSEDAMLDRYGESRLSADVLKLGHHGSRSSSSIEWLRTVDPQLAIASCGLDNSYGHPHAEIVKRLRDLGIKLYRTDECGSVVVGSDGKQLTVTTRNAAA